MVPVPKHYYIGIFHILYEILSKRDNPLSGYSIMSCLLWQGIFLLIFVGLSSHKDIRKYIGNREVLFIILLFVFGLFFPVDIPQQKIICANWLKPVGNILRSSVYEDIRVMDILLFLWIVGIMLQALRYIMTVIKVNGIKKRLPMEEIAVPESAAYFLPAGTKVYICYGISVPMSLRWQKRMILIPNKNYTEKEIYHIIRHEAMHLKLHDHSIVLLTEILCIVYWWNPCVYILKRNVTKNLEIRCDMEAVRGMDKDEKIEYMKSLVTVFKERHGGLYAGLGLLGKKKYIRTEIKERFLVLETELSEGKHSFSHALVLVFSIAIMCMSYRYVLSPLYMPGEYTSEYSGDVFTPLGEYVGTLGNMDASIEALIAVDDASYITDYGDGLYTIHNVFDEQVISEEWAKALSESGVRIEKNIKSR